MKYSIFPQSFFAVSVASLIFLTGCSYRKKKPIVPETIKKTTTTLEEFPLISSKAGVTDRTTEFDPAIESFVLREESNIQQTAFNQPAPEAPIDLAWNEPKTAHVVHFEYDSDKLTPAERSELKTVIAQASETKDPIVLRGHACLYSPVATSQYNLVLSEKRGVAVKNEMTKAGIDPERITVVGIGNEEPITTVMTKDAQAVNRRVQVTMVHA